METKQCPRCKKEKELSEFYSCKGRKLSSYCNQCSLEYKREYYQKNKSKHNPKRYAYKAKRRDELRELIKKEKENKPCVDCNEIHPSWAMEYDHRDPENKEFVIANAVRAGYSWDIVKKEINKCDLVCALCHRYRTHGQKRAT